jgi:hypothetical protein
MATFSAGGTEMNLFFEQSARHAFCRNHLAECYNFDVVHATGAVHATWMQKVLAWAGQDGIVRVYGQSAGTADRGLPAWPSMAKRTAAHLGVPFWAPGFPGITLTRGSIHGLFPRHLLTDALQRSGFPTL